MTSTSDDLPDAPDHAAHEGALGAAVARLPKTVAFAARHIGGGYDRAEVDAFVEELSRTVDDVRSALAAERQELANLRAENARLRAAADADLEQEIALGAVELLSQAQLIADKAIADAERYARDVVLAARSQYREVLERAETTAQQVSGAAAPAPAAAASASADAPVPVAPPLPEIEYVRTYAKVAQIQLRSVLDALTEQVDRLGELPTTTGAVPTATGAVPTVHTAPVTGSVPIVGAAPEPASEHAAQSEPSTAQADADEIPTEEPNWLPEVPVPPAVQRQTYIAP